MTILRAFRTGAHLGRHVGFIAAVALLAGACTNASGAAAPQAAAPASASADPSASSSAVTTGPVAAPVGMPGSGGPIIVGPGGAGGGMAIAYPYPGYPGTPGLAPDHTIVVSGFGQAPMAPDQSNRAATQQVALKAALADAKAQADLVATATRVTIQGVLSVSVSSSQGFIGPVPMMVGAQPGAAPGPGVPTPGQPQIAPVAVLAVTVTVAYRIG
jgi:Protein of unknown function (DUF541)